METDTTPRRTRLLQKGGNMIVHSTILGTRDYSVLTSREGGWRERCHTCKKRLRRQRCLTGAKSQHMRCLATPELLQAGFQLSCKLRL